MRTERLGITPSGLTVMREVVSPTTMFTAVVCCVLTPKALMLQMGDTHDLPPYLAKSIISGLS